MEENINIQNGKNPKNTEQANKTVEPFDDRPVLINVDHVNMEFVLSNEKVDNLKEFVIRKIKKNYKVNKFKALSDITFQVKQGQRLAIMGLNGAGKSTLLKTIVGVYKPTSGTITKHGVMAPLIELGAGFDPEYTGKENIYLYGAILGYSREFLDSKVQDIIDFSELGHFIDVPLKNYSSGMRARLGFSIATAVDPDILILDEPTAVLTPQETKKLFNVLRNMKNDNKSIIIITHKLNEVMEISDKVSVLRKGEYIGTVNTADATEASLTEMMVGKKVDLNIERTEVENKEDRLIVNNMCYVNREGVKVLNHVSFTAKSGEILGIAGIAGSGQRELLESIAGLRHLTHGSIIYNNAKTGSQDNLRDKTPVQIRDLGIRLSFVPEDRLGMGLVGNMDIIDNMMLRSYKKGKTVFLEKKEPRDLAEKIINDLEVVTPSANTPVRRLSGGNVQKVLVGREIAASPTVLMAAYPVRGLDINSSYLIYNLLNEQKEKGVAVIFVGEDLDVLLELCDRIVVISSGQISDIVDARTATKEQLGLLMTKSQEGNSDDK